MGSFFDWEDFMPASPSKEAPLAPQGAPAPPRGKSALLEAPPATAAAAPRWSIVASAATPQPAPAAQPSSEPDSLHAALTALPRLRTSTTQAAAPAPAPAAPASAEPPAPSAATPATDGLHEHAAAEDAESWVQSPACTSPTYASPACLLKSASGRRRSRGAALARTASGACALPRRLSARLVGSLHRLRRRLAGLACAAPPTAMK